MITCMTRTVRAAAALLSLAACALPVHAHDVWVAPQDDRLLLFFGHAGKLEPVVAAKLVFLAAGDGDGRALPVRAEVAGEKALQLQVRGKPTLVAATYDNGYWTKTTEGTKNLRKNEVSGGLGTSHAVKFAKTLLAWNGAVARPSGQALELVPQGLPQAGVLPVQVLWQGRPLAAAKVERSSPDQAPVLLTDAAGVVRVPVQSGVPQRLTVAQRVERVQDPETDTYTASATLWFTAP